MLLVILFRDVLIFFIPIRGRHLFFLVKKTIVDINQNRVRKAKTLFEIYESKGIIFSDFLNGQTKSINYIWPTYGATVTAQLICAVVSTYTKLCAFVFRIHAKSSIFSLRDSNRYFAISYSF